MWPTCLSFKTICSFHHSIQKKTSCFKISSVLILDVDNYHRETRNLKVAPAVGHSQQELWPHGSGTGHSQSQTCLSLCHNQSLLEPGLISLKATELRGLCPFPLVAYFQKTFLSFVDPLSALRQKLWKFEIASWIIGCRVLWSLIP